MSIKAILYIVAVPITIWSLDSINIEKIFKKHKIYQARFLYIILSMSLSYLIVNFLYDFFTYSKFV